MGTIAATPPAVIAMCGQDVEIITFTGLVIFQIQCMQFNGTSIVCNETIPNQVRGFKDGVEIEDFPGAILAGGGGPPISDNLCGTYTFLIENSCGRDVATSVVRCPGQFLWGHAHTLPPTLGSSSSWPPSPKRHITSIWPQKA